MRLFIFSYAIFVLLLAGCHLMETDITKMDPKKLPDVVAFQDDFTRKFMGSVDEVEEGFYLFQSKTGRYTMMYPENGRMQSTFYGFTGEDYEKIRYAGNDEVVTGAMYTVDLVYKNSKDTIRFSTHLAVASRGLRYDGDFERIETEDTEIYFAKNTFPVDGERVGSYNFFGVVKSKDSNRTLRYTYVVYCDWDEKTCDYDVEEIEKHVKKLMKSVTFEPDDRQE